MKKIFIFCLIVFLTFFVSASQARNIILLDSAWRFIQSDVPGAQLPDYNDSSWQQVCVPHDWAISGNFNMNIDLQYVKVIEDGDKTAKLRTGRTGALPMFGVGWYRRVLPIESTDKDKRIFIEFDGAMRLAKVYLNGHFVGERPYGYSSFSFDVTKYITFGKKNVLAVRLENKPESSRWYTGAGIYRNVRLVKTSSIHVDHWGTQITTPVITAKEGTVNIKTTITGEERNASKLKLVTEIYDPAGVKVGANVSELTMNQHVAVNQTVKIRKPKLWSIETPVVYRVKSKVYLANNQVDEYESTFGFRSLRFDKDEGFFLNGKPVKIKGVCLHHDLGPVGAAVNRRATERQLMLMKEMGANAIRTSHNPPSPELLNLCDSLGLMVMDEAFDEWEMGKNINGYHLYFDEWSERDIRDMVRRDRNHPCVIMWSIGNEVREQGTPQGKTIAHRLTSYCHQEDSTRPVTAALNNHTAAIKCGMADELDLVGFNYKPFDYVRMHKQYPNYVLFGSETASTVSSRGVYKFPVKEIKSPWHNDYQVSAYDLEYPGWATTPDTEFQQQDNCNFIQGEFVWTGFDYLGEPTPYSEGTPARSSYFGIVDLAGLKKDRFYLYQSHWSTQPVLHLLPHWTWPGMEGRTIPVYCYTNYPKAELFVNGKSMGIKEKNVTNKYTRYRLMWNNVVYEPGEIKVVAYDADNKAVAQEVVKTAGKPYTIKLTADRDTIRAGGKDLSFVTVEIMDKDGNLCPAADNMLFFDVTGAGTLKALCNGDATDQTSFASNYMRTFNGKMIAVIESSTHEGPITLKVMGGILKPQKLKIEAGK